ncbi:MULTISPECIES: 8-oxo-dGTP diphosphatase MutT [Edwardsiella]|uniref:8-oxo-dGTP diphosphatase n=2 Tax=Edwardsiella anguillarum TaxID=1821960 RepID=A0A076LJY9_9GAMM|nr:MULTISPECIES: 8-oxo-dGTP diphosphatase MutT [Edwardsiella]AKM48783.1 nucleoside triphosphate hydrolase [Edwardsiella sp. EA181011]GAJ66851.1 mutator MutT protein [Edwardsiella piscicida]AIJ08855.1 Mutator mutT protein (7,8-dihydro-8-oxoguanine-triphosphatase) [Edwardsiella anguillarum ET080813]AKR76852.1 8-oxo-dGTP diphosphatase MutT [Edwardsiella sp. LADL05-105]KAB0592380.1 8-oxo-dGTP diphosphatase MutT [Edwardsiella anguillarum]
MTQSLPTLQIAVGIIRNARQEIFIARRQSGSHLAGLWEFPGGKIEPGEHARQALTRELQEEVGISVAPASAQLLRRIEHTFSDRRVVLHFFLVGAWQGEPCGREGQETRWVAAASLCAADFPAPNRAIIEALRAQG